MASPTTYYRPPAQSEPVLVRTERTKHLPRYHWAARLNGNLLTPEACNLDQAVALAVVPDVAPDTRPSQLCARCFRGHLAEGAA
jgi:hypothetical protein